MAYFIPIIIAACCGDNWVLNLLVCAALFAVSLIPILLLPETGKKGKLAQEGKLGLPGEDLGSDATQIGEGEFPGEANELK